jgi:hypothetical protein
MVLAAVVMVACKRPELVTDVKKSVGATSVRYALGNSLVHPMRPPIPVVPQVPSIAERFAELVPEFAGAYRNGTLVIRVTDLRLSRSGGEAAARALLQGELSARGRGDLTLSFEEAKYDYRRLKSWLDASLDALGTYKAVSWGIDQRTSQIHVGLPDVASQRGFQAALSKLGVPSDAIVTSIESADKVW